MDSSKLVSVWHGLKARCCNPKNNAFKDYGGRGITVCEEWHTDYQSFKSWALENGYARGLQVDRIDNDGPYSPENCQFVTHMENSQKRRTSKLTYADTDRIIEMSKSGMSQTDIANQFGISQSMVSQTVNKQKWKAVEDPNEEYHRPA